MGFDLSLTLDQAGFYPQGGGRLSCVIRPVNQIQPLQLARRGDLVRLSGISAVAELEQSIADRQKRQAIGRLNKRFPALLIKIARLPARSNGTFLLLLAEYSVGRACYCALGERGKPAERVADECVDAVEAYLETDAAIDQFLADQLLIPLSMAHSPSQIYTTKVTQHLLTNAEVIHRFLPVQIDISGEIGEPGFINVTPAPLRNDE
jgi:RNA 3'-terminal phosphate cyclase (ATP)